ncbi:MFS transporter [Agrobacterium tumefaciens]|uniref:MFS transporter n=1 Tax=Agrobacterium tumefaciens TaxID=358 RepID=UPI00287ECE1A|nr:MFS transporter [Agrobacterium tumefaciens]MDS7594818.1 MFS transporter [Agrobacterium tumefaciens]
MRSRAATRDGHAQGLSRLQTVILAASAGLSVANIYYAQPLLDLIAGDLGISPAAVGLIVTLTQIGYGLGLIFIVPLGDIIDRRHLIVVLSLLSATALAVVATATTATMLLMGMIVVGLLAVLVQILVAHAAALASSSQRGRIVGAVTSGVVTGILAARTVAGVVADFGGWRAVYLMSAILMIMMVAALLSKLPRQTGNRAPETYINALVSIPRAFIGEPALLLRGTLALLIFASFSTFWTALVLPLSAPPFSYSHGQIGLFGLVGVAGAVAATYAGKLSDSGYGKWTTGVSLALLLASWGLIFFLPTSMPLLLAGVLLLDLAVHAVHVTSLGVIVALHPQMSSRLIGGYMVFYSIGSAIGAVASTTAYARLGWTGVSFLGATFSAGALVVWMIALTRREPA